MSKYQVGVIGLAVMGKNLALNIAGHGYSVALFNRSADKTHSLLDEAAGKKMIGTYSLEELAGALEKPRKIIMMVKAGAAVDDTIKQLLPHLEPGDILIDGGNSFYQDTIRRNRELEAKGIHFIGTGVSGGEEGALNGPAIMPGGEKAAYQAVEKILTDISAKVDGEPCCTYIGKDGAGHFVKMVHNGIEYADMQLICEAYFLMKEVLHMSVPEMQQTFQEWNTGELSSYLIEITADILTKKDTETDKYMVDVILDSAGQKGTGKWTSQGALDLGAATPTITAAVFERYLSAMKPERVGASKLLSGPKNAPVKDKAMIEAIRKALYASKICSYAQGFSMMSAAAEKFDWHLNLGNISMIFRGGCIIRAQFLNKIKEAYDKNSKLTNLLLDDYFRQIVAEYQDSWREVIIAAVAAGIPVPAFSTALSYFDSYRTAQLPANLLQAQRDYFGAHTYQRNDKAGIFHNEWYK
ncbi:MAG: NADP-dependent phosphogluconate dehydrogenase [Pelosinus sp.]|nr:NADP-dependent phosphogluconate dehydrogenase [Pelosinus sp.]